MKSNNHKNYAQGNHWFEVLKDKGQAARKEKERKITQKKNDSEEKAIK